VSGRGEDAQPPVQVVWRSPPRRRRTSIYTTAIEEVKEKPGQWAHIRCFSKQSAAWSARKAFLKLVEGDERWEARTGRDHDASGDGREPHYGLWVRYRTVAQMGRS
jgi:hypothetical protein